MDKSDSHVTILTIAKEAGVSVATISRYFSNPQIISQETKEKVKRVIDKYGFFPSIAGLKKDKYSGIKIVLLLDETKTNIHFLELLKGGLRGSLIYNYTMLVFLDQDERYEHCLDNIVRNRTSFLILTKLKDNKFIEIMKKNKITIGYLLPFNEIDKNKIAKDDILLTYKETPDFYFLGLLAISLFKGSILEAKKRHLLVKGESLLEINIF